MPLTLAEERVFTAYHEAAHLAAALAFRVMARGATIRPAAERLGLVITVDRRSNSPSAGIEGWLAGLDRLGTHARAVELMAGLAAEEKAGHPAPHRFAWKDRANAYDLLVTRFGDHDVAERELDRALADARQMMARPDVWSAVTMMARELLQRETLWARNWRHCALAAARLVHGQHLSERELARWPGSDVVAADEAAERARDVHGGSAARHGTLAENAKWGMVLVAFFGLLFCFTFWAQQKSEEKWRMKFQERARAELQERLANAPLPLAVIRSFQPDPLQAAAWKYGLRAAPGPAD